MQFKQEMKERKEKFDRDEYRTPPEIFNPLDAVFDFRTDGAATPENALCSFYLTKEDNSLEVGWKEYSPLFINPPYSGGSYGPFLEKARQEYMQNEVESVLLVPASLETKAFRPVWEDATYLIILNKRVSYLSPGGVPQKGNSFLSAVACFTNYYPEFVIEERLGHLGYILDLPEGLVGWPL